MKHLSSRYFYGNHFSARHFGFHNDLVVPEIPSIDGVSGGGSYYKNDNNEDDLRKRLKQDNDEWMMIMRCYIEYRNLN